MKFICAVAIIFVFFTTTSLAYTRNTPTKKPATKSEGDYTKEKKAVTLLYLSNQIASHTIPLPLSATHS